MENAWTRIKSELYGNKSLVVGIDVGINTGVAVWDSTSQKFVEVVTLPILKAFALVRKYKSDTRMVFVEDPRQVKYKTDRRKSQGAGSVKRDAQIWEDYLKMYEIPATFVRPRKEITKVNSGTFQNMTGYMERTNEHSRDAALLVFKR